MVIHTQALERQAQTALARLRMLRDSAEALKCTAGGLLLREQPGVSRGRLRTTCL